MQRIVKIGFFVLLALLAGCSRYNATPNFQQLTVPNVPNHYLVCPQKYCSVTPDAYSIVYPISAEDLFYAFNQMVSQQSHVNFTATMPEFGQFQLEQSSIVFGLPDIITVQFIALSDTTSTLAIYSQSKYGYYDFGTNKRRINSWLDQLNKIVGVVPQK